MGKMGTTVALAGAAVGAVAGVTAIACAKRAAGLRPSAPAGTPLTAEGYHAGDDAVERFRALLRVPTISRDDPALVDRTPFEAWCPPCASSSPACSRCANSPCSTSSACSCVGLVLIPPSTRSCSWHIRT